MEHPFLALRRLRVMSGGRAVYDQAFHLGVNIIRGDNGSGKSTLADFIFYALGGEFDDWKAAARHCDEVLAEIQTKSGTISLRRPIAGKQSPIHVYFGSLDSSSETNTDNWTRYPIRRQTGQESISQVLFKAVGIPESESEGSANVTMHQILRLMYADQRTPTGRLFRFESFDTKTIREAVGELLCGGQGYEAYDLLLRLRALEEQCESVSSELNALRQAVPTKDSLAVENIDAELDSLAKQIAILGREVDNVDSHVQEMTIAEFLKNRRELQEKLKRARGYIAEAEGVLEKLDWELEDLGRFQEYLTGLVERIGNTEKSADAIGNIDFVRCPCCLTRLSESAIEGQCVVCGAPVDPENQRARYLQVRLDVEAQIRETAQLLEAKSLQRKKTHEETRRHQLEYRTLLADYQTKYDASNSPRESFLAERYRKIGQAEGELKRLEQLREISTKVHALALRHTQLGVDIEAMRERKRELETIAHERLEKARALISANATRLLATDLPRQDEFFDASRVDLDFADDAIIVDGAMNFAESSNVILKNTVLLSMWSAACRDSDFCYPRFLLMDNVEDKGMEPARSHKFQENVVLEARTAECPHQIIFTTSMLNPKLDTEDLVVGPAYTKERRTLELRAAT